MSRLDTGMRRCDKFSVIPAKVGIQTRQHLDTGMRRCDKFSVIPALAACVKQRG